MANDSVKRVNYYTGQFLEAADFTSEQDYHLSQRRRLNRALYYGPGILDGGFIASPITNDNTKISIARGLAIDEKGRELFLSDSVNCSLPTGNSDWLYVIIYYAEAEDDVQIQDASIENPIQGKTRIKEEPTIEFDSNPDAVNSKNEHGIVIGRVHVDVQGSLIESVDSSVRQIATARLPRDLIVGQGSYGTLHTRHINGKDWQGDSEDHLYLNWNNARNVHLGFGEGTTSSLLVSGKVGVGTTDPRTSLDIRGPNAPIGSDGQRDIALSFDAAGSARIRAFRGGSWDTSMQFLTNAATRGSDSPEVRLHIDPTGNIGVGTDSPRAKLEVASGAIVPAAGQIGSSGIWFPPNQDPSGVGWSDSAWIAWNRRGATGEAMTLEIGVSDNTDDHIALMPSGNVGVGMVDPGSKLSVDIGTKANDGIELRDQAGRWMLLGSNSGAGSFNPLTQANDLMLMFSNGTIDTGGLTIGQWSSNNRGLRIDSHGNIGIGTAFPGAKLEVQGAALINDGGSFAVENNHMAPGSLTVGSIKSSFGGGNNWNANTAGILLETENNTEIAVHDSGTRIASLVYYEGDSNRITIGRDMGWQSISKIGLMGNVGIGTNEPSQQLHVSGNTLLGSDVQINGNIIANGPSSSFKSITYAGTQNRLDVAEGGAATIRCADLEFGHSSRRGTPGRALVDENNNGTKTLVVNYGPDWPYVRIEGSVRVNGSLVNGSSRELKDKIASLTSVAAKRIILELEPVSFTYRNDAAMAECLGFIAEDVPAEVGTTDRKAVSYNHVVAVLTRLVKDQQNMIEALQARMLNIEFTTGNVSK